ncbi:MAG: helix-turn-helix domain-containing protein [Mariprofundales bacterium]
MSDELTNSDGATQTSKKDVRRMVTIEVGQRLRLAREAQKLSLASVTEDIKLRPIQLEALESGCWQRLPNETLALAFLRQYAVHLNVDIDDALQKLKSDSLSFHQPLTFPDPAISPNRKWAVGAAVLFVLLLLIWNLLGSSVGVPLPAAVESSLVDVVEKGMVADLPTTTASVAPIRRERAVVATPAPTPVDQPAPITVVAAQPKVTAVASASIKRAVGQPKGVAPMVKPVSSPTSPAMQEKTTAVPDVAKEQPKPVSLPKKVAALPATDGAHEFSFQAAKDRVWLLLEIPDGKGGRKRFREVIIRPHHSIELVREDGVVFVSVGNAGAIKITYEGKTLYGFGKFGRRGTVIRHRKVEAPSKTAAEAVLQ